MPNAAPLWMLFVILLFVHTFLRRQARGGQVPYNLPILLALAVILVAAVPLAGVVHGVVMALAWGVVATFGASESSPGKGKAGAGRGPARRASPAQGQGHPQDAHIDRLSRGEISLDEYFKEGEKQSRDSSRKLQELAATAEIAAVLARRKLSLRGFLALRERLVEVRDLEWAILSDPKNLEKLIRLVEAHKTQSEIGMAFRGLLARPVPAS